MSLSHFLKSANRLGLSILQNQQGRIASSASNLVHHCNKKIEIIANKGSSSCLPSILRGRPYSQSCSDDDLYKASVCLIVLPLLASSMMVFHLSTLTYYHEVLLPYYDRVFNLHIDGKPVYSEQEVSEASYWFHDQYPQCGYPKSDLLSYIIMNIQSLWRSTSQKS